MREVGAFEAFFSALHGHAPYRWQSRLAAEVASSGTWRGALAAPTGAGKTAVIDIALWHLAKEASSPERRAPLRIVFAVNRRVIVDQAYERARMIADKIAEARSGILADVREALSAFSSDIDRPLHVEQLRGGLPREDDWARTPSQPTVLCTTVDQLGSRLLFRGYGISDRMAPIHAGLLGNDVLILLDEAHLSDAFSETLRGVTRWRTEADDGLLLPFQVCRLTATPRGEDEPFRVSQDEREEEAIARRLKALKRARLKQVSDDSLASELAREAKELANVRLDRKPVVAVIVNRVKLAREVFEILNSSAGDGADHADAILLTGRVRPVDRDRLIGAYKGSLMGGHQGDRVLYVVATQCIEAGADFDFDAMVSQIAPLDALIQRFGRLARSGNRIAGEPAPAVIVGSAENCSPRTDDPVYGSSMGAAWKWLQLNKTAEGAGKTKSDWVDFGPDVMARLIDKDPDAAAACFAPRQPAPFLREADANFFSMTFPRPDPEPDLRLYLHGRVDIETDVSLVWRADLDARDFSGDEPSALAIAAAMRPMPGEALAVPIWQARAWLHDQASAHADFADVAGRERELEGQASIRPAVLLSAGREPVVLTRSSKLRPGDTLVVPSTYGGCDSFGWSPQSNTAVEDVADLASAPYRRKRVTLRVHRSLWKQAGLEPWLPWSDVLELLSGRALSHTIAKSIVDRLEVVKCEARSPWRTALEVLAIRKRSARTQVVYPIPDDETIVGSVLFAGAETFGTGEGEDAASHTVPEELSVHAGKVRDKAGVFAKMLRLPEGLAQTLAHAGHLHDDGKADERFQAYLHAFADAGWRDKVLAKSGAATGTHDGAWDAAGLSNNGWRHEVLSVQMAIPRLQDLPDTVDRALALWLVGTHHGYGRPFFRHDDPWDAYARTVNGISVPPDPGPHRLDFEWDGSGPGEVALDWAGLFSLLKRRYGIWGLAFLEAVLRLADHRASEDSVRAFEGSAP